MAASNNLLAKVIVVGDSGTGKTCLVNRYCKGEFRGDSKPTVGTDFSLKKLQVDGRNITLQMWDTAGQERYRTMTAQFYRGAQAGVLVFDLTNQASFENLSVWQEALQLEMGDRTIPYILIGNKLDAVDDRQVNRQQAEQWCKKQGNIVYYETSAKDDVNLDDAFTAVAIQVLKYEDELSISQSVRGAPVTPGQWSSQPEDSKCAC